jgi:hypothetical protein
MAEPTAQDLEVEVPELGIVKLPAYIMDSTGQSILKALKSQHTDLDKKLEQLVKLTAEKNKQDTDSAEEKEKIDREILDALKKSRQSDTPDDSGSGSGVGGALKDLVKGIMPVTKTFAALSLTTTALIGALGAAMTGVRRLGDYGYELSREGVGLDSARGSVFGLTANMQQLGLSLSETEELLKNYSGAVQAVGKNTFGTIQKEFAKITKHGADFGMTMADASEYIAEDLDLRRSLGILEGISATKTAAQTKKLYDQQLKASAMLGKSIEEIRGDAKAAVDDNVYARLRMAEISLSAAGGAEGARRLLDSMQSMATELSGMGLDRSTISQITNELVDNLSFSSDAGFNLFSTFRSLGNVSNDVVSTMLNVNRSLESKDLEGAALGVEQMAPAFKNMVKNMGSEEIESLRRQLAYLGQQGNDFAMSLGKMLTVIENGEETLSLPTVVKASAEVTNAMRRLRGGFSSMFTSMGAALGAPLMGLTSAFYDTSDAVDDQGNAVKGQMGILSAFGKAAERVIGAFSTMFSVTKGTETSMNHLGDSLRDSVVPSILNMGERIAKWIESEGFTRLKENIISTAKFLKGFGTGVIFVAKIIMTVFGFLGDVISNVGSVFSKFLELVPPFQFAKLLFEKGLDLIGFAFEKMEITISDVGTGLGVLVASLWAASKAIKAIKFTKKVIGGIRDWRGGASGGAGAGGGRGSGAGGALGGAAGAAGRGGVGGMLTNIALGLRAIGRVPYGALLKAGLILGGITLAVMGFAKALDIAKDAFVPFGGMIKEILEGAAPVVESFGKAYESAITGVSTIIDSVLGGIGDVVTSVSNAYAELRTAGAQAQAIKLDAQASAIQKISDIPAENIIATSGAIKGLAENMKLFGESVGRDGWIRSSGADIDKQYEQIGVFAKFSQIDHVGIKNTSDSLTDILGVYRNFASLNYTALSKNAQAIERINQATVPSMLLTAKPAAGNFVPAFSQAAAPSPSPSMDSFDRIVQEQQAKADPRLAQTLENNKKNNLPEIMSRVLTELREIKDNTSKS